MRKSRSDVLRDVCLGIMGAIQQAKSMPDDTGMLEAFRAMTRITASGPMPESLNQSVALLTVGAAVTLQAVGIEMSAATLAGECLRVYAEAVAERREHAKRFLDGIGFPHPAMFDRRKE